MPIINCTKLLQAKKAIEPKVHAEAFVNHVLPKVVELDLEANLLTCIKRGLPAEVPIFTYNTTKLLVNGSSIPYGFGVTVAEEAYQSCDCLPCGTTIGKALSGWAALELLSMTLGPNIRVYKKEGVLIETRPTFTISKVTLIARFENKSLKRSTSAVKWWPNAGQVTVMDNKVVWPQEIKKNKNETIEEYLTRLFGRSPTDEEIIEEIAFADEVSNHLWRDEIVEYLTRTFGEAPTEMEILAEMSSREAS